jgi:hypothetical protein
MTFIENVPVGVADLVDHGRDPAQSACCRRRAAMTVEANKGRRLKLA